MKKIKKDIGKKLCYLLRHSKEIIDIDRHGSSIYRKMVCG